MTEPRPSQQYTAATGDGSDVRPDFLRLARLMARDCNTPGEYVINLRVSEYRSEPLTVNIAKSENIRTAQIERRNDEK